MPDYPLGQLPQPDTSIYQRFAPQATPEQNPLGMLNEMGQIQQRGLANAQAQQQLRARTAMGPILQAAVGADGQIDWAKAVAGMAAHPETAWMAGDVMTQVTQRKLTDAETMLKTIEAGQKQYTAVGNTVTGLLEKGNNLTQGDLAQGVAGLVATGAITPQVGTEFMKHAAQFGNGAGLFQHLQHIGLAAQGATEAYKNLRNIQMVQNGGHTQPVIVSNVAGTVTPTGPGMVHSPTWDQYGKPITETDPNSGTQRQVPQGPAMGMPQPGTTQPQQAPGINSANPVAFTEYQKGSGPVVEYEKTLRQSVAEGQVAVQAIDEMNELMKGLRTGGGAELRARAGQIAQAWGMPQEFINRIVGGTSKEALGDMQALMKLAVRQAVQTLSQDMGGNRKTEGEIMLYFDRGSPNVDMDPTAIAKIQAFNKELLHQKLKELTMFDRFRGETDPQTGETKFSPAFRTNPSGWFPLWSKALEMHYQNKPKFHDLRALEKEAVKALKGGSSGP